MRWRVDASPSEPRLVGVLLLLLLSALLLTAARLALKSADHFRPQLERWLSEVLELPVRVGGIEGELALCLSDPETA